MRKIQVSPFRFLHVFPRTCTGDVRRYQLFSVLDCIERTEKSWQDISRKYRKSKKEKKKEREE